MRLAKRRAPVQTDPSAPANTARQTAPRDHTLPHYASPGISTSSSSITGTTPSGAVSARGT